ncbi:branched-chain amino acid ABC transporter permease [Butyrivibrio sp. JL13D10]|uniref:branched-chain amino acid ABC transporter permease n=1 Tax=Butyrivibrio sp. JL13D10 TaxID=3236815 RepID=UPI0038B6863F
MTKLIQSLMYGLNLGSIYALTALGYTMVYGIIRMINFAHGDFIMVGGFTLFYVIPVMSYFGLPLWFAVVAAIGVCILVGVLTEQIAYKPVRGQGPTTALITALGMSLVLENGALVVFGSAPRNVPPMFNLPTINFLGAGIPGQTILTLIIGLVVMGVLTLFIRYTKLGKAMRAVPEDKVASTLVGINVNKIITTTFAIGAGLAAIASMMYTTSYVSIKNELGISLGLKAFVAAVLGGIGSIPGAMIGGLLLGIVEILVKVYMLPGTYEAVTYLILIFVLLVKPTGLLGKVISEKV